MKQPIQYRHLASQQTLNLYHTLHLIPNGKHASPRAEGRTRIETPFALGWEDRQGQDSLSLPGLGCVQHISPMEHTCHS